MRCAWLKNVPAVEILARLQTEEAFCILVSGALDEEIFRRAPAEKPAAIERIDQALPFSYESWKSRATRRQPLSE